MTHTSTCICNGPSPSVQMGYGTKYTWQLVIIHLPEIQEPLKGFGWRKFGSRICSIRRGSPKGPRFSSGGVKITTDTATEAKMMQITNTAMLMPFQFFWLSSEATSSCVETERN